MSESITNTVDKKQGKALSLQDAMTLAHQHYSAGACDKSKQVLLNIIKVHPNFVGAWHLLSVVDYQLGDLKSAMLALDKAIALDPNNALFYSNYAEMSRSKGELEKALKYALRSVELSPNAAAALSNLGLVYFDLDELDKAAEFQKKALNIQATLAPALNNLASILREKDDKEGAVEKYKELLKIQPTYVEAMSNLGATLAELDRFAEALPLLMEAIKIKPNYAQAHCNIGLVFFGMEDYKKALAAYSNAIKIKPDYVQAFVGMAKLYQENNNLEQAEQWIKKALSIDSANAEALGVLGTIALEQGEHIEAESIFRRVLVIKPGYALAMVGLGTLLMEKGDLAEAEAIFLSVLSTDPDSIPALTSMPQVKKIKQDDPVVETLEALLHSEKGLVNKKKMAIHFSLGKCYDDLGKANEAFAHFKNGCELKRKSFDYQSSQHHEHIQTIKSVFTKKFIKSHKGSGCLDSTPIFVLGMPRSGTTLTEQIIASHPSVFGAGELPDLSRLIRSVEAALPEKYPFNVAGFATEQFAKMGAEYVQGIRRYSADSMHITDKMPANFMYLGLIHMMLPNAKIIHVKRNPVDTALSCYTKIFNRGQYFSYDLKELGEHYRDYVELMAHWKSVLPAKSFYEVQYEDLVADNEKQAKKLIKYCGLPWDSACLESHKTERNVRTASVAQVRQPIYKSSVERWRAYEQHLQPLLDVLGDLVPVSESAVEK